MSVIEMTDENWYETVSNSDKPLIVEYWADWCRPCTMMAPIIDQIAEEYADTIAVAKVNVDTQNWLRGDNIVSIPHIRVYSGGEYVGDISGAMPKAALLQELKKFIEF